MFAARFAFDRLSFRWASRDRRTPGELQRTLAATTIAAFAIPGAGSRAPICHLAIHAYDIRGPLGIQTPISPVAARGVLDEITRGKHAVPVERLDGLRFEAVDTEWGIGDGPVVAGPSGALMSALRGRRSAVDDLAGNGIPAFRSRLTLGQKVQILEVWRTTSEHRREHFAALNKNPLRIPLGPKVPSC